MIQWFYDSLPPCAVPEPALDGVDVGDSDFVRPPCALCDSRRRVLTAIPYVYRNYKDLGVETLKEKTDPNTQCPVMRSATPLQALLQVGYLKCAAAVTSDGAYAVSTFLGDLCCELLLALTVRKTEADDSATLWWRLLEDAVQTLGLRAALGVEGNEELPQLQPLLSSQHGYPGGVCGAVERGTGCLFPLERWTATVRHVCEAVDGVVHLPSCIATRGCGNAINSGGLLNVHEGDVFQVLSSRVDSWGSLLAAVKILSSCLCGGLLCNFTVRCGHSGSVQGDRPGGVVLGSQYSTKCLTRLAVQTSIAAACRRHASAMLGDGGVVSVGDAVLCEARHSIQRTIRQFVLRRCAHGESCVNSDADRKQECCCWLSVSSSLVSAAACVLLAGNLESSLQVENIFSCFVESAVEELQRRQQQHEPYSTGSVELLTRFFCSVVYQLSVWCPADILSSPVTPVRRALARHFVLAMSTTMPNVAENPSDTGLATATVSSWLLDHMIRRYDFPSCTRPCDCCRRNTFGADSGDLQGDAGTSGDELLLRVVLGVRCDKWPLFGVFLDKCTAACRLRVNAEGSPSPFAEGYYYGVLLDIVEGMAAASFANLSNCNLGVEDSPGVAGNTFPQRECLTFFKEWMAAIQRGVNP